MKTVMVSGHFDSFHGGHLSYIKQAFRCGDNLYCVVSTDKQLLMKKGKVNIPETARQEIMQLVLEGLKVSHPWKCTYPYDNVGVNTVNAILNIWDKDTTLVAEALRALNPNVFFRGGDKTLEDMPLEERAVCDELGIMIVHAKLEYDTHGSKMQL